MPIGSLVSIFVYFRGLKLNSIEGPHSDRKKELAGRKKEKRTLASHKSAILTKI